MSDALLGEKSQCLSMCVLVEDIQPCPVGELGSFRLYKLCYPEIISNKKLLPVMNEILDLGMRERTVCLWSWGRLQKKSN